MSAVISFASHHVALIIVLAILTLVIGGRFLGAWLIDRVVSGFNAASEPDTIERVRSRPF